MKEPLSPLRYPGSKSALAEYLAAVVKENLLVGAHLYETYAGGASVSLSLLKAGIISHATIVELDPLVYSFWTCVKDSPEQLCDKIMRASVSLQTWKSFQKYLDPTALGKYSILELGFAGLFLNRTSFSGIIGAGPIGGMSQGSAYKVDCRFNKERIIRQVRSLAGLTEGLTVVHSDALRFLRNNRASILKGHSLVYLDPPYYAQGKRLYRYNYADKEHAALANFIVAEKYPWVISYDPHPVIRQLFSGQAMTPIYLSYAVKKSRRADELLISNLALGEPEYLGLDDSMHAVPESAVRSAYATAY